jgi:acetyl-CoA carboxylase biotin carboxylase subunit
MIKKVLIANRGEIAIRIAKACRELNIETVGIFSENDINTLHVSYPDEVYNLGTGSLKDTYLNIDKIISIAKKSNCQAIHPGYGFLSENYLFSKACEENDIIFIGPTSYVIEIMGSKLKARSFMKEAGLPVTPGTDTPVESIYEIEQFANKYGYPIALKASAGGGGRGFRQIYSKDEILPAFEGAKREAKNYFSDDTIFVEKFLDNPRHIEVQILADNFGNIINVGERNCSIQRRHQKLVEEAPSPCLDENLRQKILDAAVKGAKSLGYRSAGTFEFLEQDGNFYFMEVNTRLQVEHPVTEMVYGIDLVKEQINIANGNKLSYTQDDVKKRGHSIECRITVEDVKNNFRPSAGKITEYKEPSGFGVRVDSTGKANWNIPKEYDSMISKLIVWDENRERAINKMYRALSEYVIKGVPTTIPFHKFVMKNEEFIKGNYSTKFIEKNFKPKYITESYELSEYEETKKNKENIQVEINGKLFNVIVYKEEKDKKNIQKITNKKKEEKNLITNTNEIIAPMSSTVVKINVQKGQEVKEGEVLLILEAMKMETDILAQKSGIVDEIFVNKGDTVTTGALLIKIK